MLPAFPVLLALSFALLPATAQAQEPPAPKPAASATPSATPSPAASPAAKAEPATEKATEQTTEQAKPETGTEQTAASAAPAATTDKTETSAPAAPAAAPPATPGTTNDWLPGVIGIILLGTGLFYGIRYAREKGITVADVLKRMGMEMPQDGAGTTVPLKAAKPEPAPLPPLPSLTDLAAAGAASRAGVTMAVASGGVATGNANYRTGTPRLVGISGSVQSETFPLTDTLTIGRETDNSLSLTQDTGVSRYHARLERQNGGWVVADLGSSNGTFVNGAKISGTHPLQPGDEIHVGSSRFRFEGI
ncbi:MAG: hypothetical protein OHK0029_17380 [Armatimonadaceae bacterium]